MSAAEIAVRRIVEQYDRPQPASSSPLLSAIANMKPDRHDVVGAVTIAEEALASTHEDDAFRDTLERILEFRRTDKRYDTQDMAGIVAICTGALASHEQACTAGPRP